MFSVASYRSQSCDGVWYTVLQLVLDRRGSNKHQVLFDFFINLHEQEKSNPHKHLSINTPCVSGKVVCKNCVNPFLPSRFSSVGPAGY